MYLAEAYALGCGAKIGQPYLNESFYPVPFEKYIHVHASSGMPSKDYDYWEEALDMVIDDIKAAKISLIQTGGPKDRPLKHCYPLMGKVNIPQTAFLIRHAVAHISNDTFSAHVAGALQIPLLCLYGSTTVKNHSPYWRHPSKTILIESSRNGQLPSYAREERNKTINLIPPEDVAAAILKLLDIDKLIGIKTLLIGDSYVEEAVEYVPDTPLINDITINHLNVRMDYCFDENILANLLSKKKCNILTNKPVNLDLIRRFRKNINVVSYEISDDTEVDYISKLKSTGVKVQLVSFVREKEKQDIFKMKFFDYDVDFDEKDPAIAEGLKKQIKNGFYRSRKYLLSKGKIYLSKADWLMDKPIPNFMENISPIPNHEEFYDELEYFYIFNKT